MNINVRVRATATRPGAAEGSPGSGADLGFALDGDADRLIAVDAAGHIVDGDQVLGILALERLARARSPRRRSSASSVLSNGGLQQAVEAAGGEVVRTPVGDKYILEGMQVSGAVLGGEKSGHVIVREHTTSGDGIVTALEVLARVMTARRPGRSSPTRSRCCRSSSARVGSGTRTSGRAIRSSPGHRRRRGAARAPVGGSWSGRPAPSPRCG